jgi:hypothetical protein
MEVTKESTLILGRPSQALQKPKLILEFEKSASISMEIKKNSSSGPEGTMLVICIKYGPNP